MPEPSLIENDFLTQIAVVIEKNISNEHFGVSELASEMNMSRSNLLRKVKKDTKLSVSQLISQVRLKRAMELLRKSSLNVSEVSHQVGFNSPSYFIKCFREYYGYPPGEVGKRAQAEDSIPGNLPMPWWRRSTTLFATAGLAVAIAIGFFAYSNWPSENLPVEKSIAVLPFKNDSNDSTNLYLINGLMESTLINLQQIKNLKVISRTSAEKYRNSAVSIPEMARELKASYFVEGSGQKIGDRIVLNIQLIDGVNDRHLWGKQYRRETKDIFALQQEIATSIAAEIQVIITPEEVQRIEKIPTEDLEAYDLFLKGREFADPGGQELEKAIPYFKKAVDRDPKFALAYAAMAITYFYMDAYMAEKKYTAEIEAYADKAMLYDPKLPESLAAKAFSYIHKKEYVAAISYLEKGLEYNPNSPIIIAFLSDYYAHINPNTNKYLEYALMGVRLNIGLSDSVSTSYNYLRLGNALAQTGFMDEALKYIDKSLDYNSKNPFSRYIRAFILYSKDRDLKKTRDLLIAEFDKDSTRFDILQDIGKVSYYMADFDGAYHYYKKFLQFRETRKLDVYRYENLLIGIVLAKKGEKKKSEELITDFLDFAEHDHSIYKHLILAGYYGYIGDDKKVLEHYALFSKEDNFYYWIVLFFDKDPVLDHLKNDPEYQAITRRIEKKFWDNHGKLKVTLEEKGLL